MKCLFRTLLLLSLVIAACSAPVVAGDERIHVVLLHTNDMHGQVLPRKATWLKKEPVPLVGGITRVAAYVDRAKSEAVKNGEIVFVVDAGDWFQGTPEGLIDAGQGFVNALAFTGYDALCIGNHEFDHGIPNLISILKQSKIPAVAANLNVKGKPDRVDWVAPWRVVDRGGVSIAFVGLVTPITPEISHPDCKTIDFVDPVQALTRAQEHLKGKVDWIVPLTHLGVESDKALARAHPELELVVGGHSHTYLKEGVREGSTLIVQTGSKASAIGRVDVWLDKTTKKVLETSAKLIDLDEEPPAAFATEPVAIIGQNLVTRTEQRMKEKVGEMTATAERTKNPLASSAMGNLLTDALRDYTRSDVALMNRGGIRADFHKGPITRRDVFEVMPFDNSIVVVKLTGAELTEFVRKAVEGKAHSGIEVSGMTIEVKSDAAADKRELTGVRVAGEPVDPKKVYRVAMNSFMADGGDAYMEPVPPGEKRTDDMTLLRDMLEALFVNKKQVTAATDDRYKVTKP